MLDIERQPRKAKSIPLISLIDVVFTRQIYFMLTTSFTRSESLELALPAAEAHKPQSEASKAPDMKTLHIYISDTGETFLERDSLGEKDMADKLSEIFTAKPDRGVLVLSAGKVTVGELVKVLDHIYSAGGRNIAVADWVIPSKSSASAEGRHNG